MRGPVEAKVAYTGVTGAAIALLLGLAAYYRWFTPPPVYLSSLLVTVVSGVAGWLAPHTPRTPPVITGDLTTEIVRRPDGQLTFGASTDDVTRALIKAQAPSAAGVPPPAVQPPAPATGGAT